jgi:glycosyltransferase involved in cell wall biosynthesis
MKFSIITPNYNGAEYIEECIKSVLTQNVDFEHIIIDGISTDSSLEILTSYSHLKIISEKDHGMYDAINKGLSISEGDFISYLNSDDRYPKGALSRILYEFNNDKNLDYVYGDCRLIDHLENELYVYRVPPLFKSLLTKITVIPWAQPSVFYKRKVFDDIGNFDINYLLASDYHFMKRILLSKLNGHKVNKVLSHFMKRDEALSFKYSFEMHSEVIQIKNDLGIINRPVLDFFFNSYRKIYNFHTFFKKN